MLLEKLGTYLADTEFSDLPHGIVITAKTRLLDCLGSGLAGFRLGLYRPVLAAINPGPGKSRIWGRGESTSSREAALINSFMVHSTYLEDGSRSTGGHPSSTIIPALLALGEELSLGGDRIILGMVLGYEIFNRIGMVIYPSTVTRGFQPTAVLGSLGAAAGCAKLFDLDKAGLSHALAIGANLGSGLKAALQEPSSQPIQVGRSCEGGLVAAMLAKQGLKGNPLILEAFFDAHAEKADASDVLSGLGETYEIEKTYIKVHGGCRGNHAPLDVILKIVKENRLSVEQIESIRIGIDSVTAAAEIHWPKNGKEAQFSIPFSAAAALVYGNASLFQFTDDKVQDPEIQNVMKRVQVEIDPEMDELLPMKRGAVGEVVLKNGDRCKGRLDLARGEPEEPLSSEEVEEKFHVMAGEVLDERAPQVVEAVYNLEKLKTIEELTILLKGGQKT